MRVVSRKQRGAIIFFILNPEGNLRSNGSGRRAKGVQIIARREHRTVVAYLKSGDKLVARFDCVRWLLFHWVPPRWEF